MEVIVEDIVRQAVELVHQKLPGASVVIVVGPKKDGTASTISNVDLWTITMWDGKQVATVQQENGRFSEVVVRAGFLASAMLEMPQPVSFQQASDALQKRTPPVPWCQIRLSGQLTAHGVATNYEFSDASRPIYYVDAKTGEVTPAPAP